MKLRKGNTFLKYEDSPYQSDLIPPLLSLHQWFGACGLSTAPYRGEDDSNGGEMRRYEAVSVVAWLSLPELCHGHYPSTTSALQGQPPKVHS